MNQREFFDTMAEKWDTVCKHDTEKIKYILQLLNIENGAKILDVGTGTGILVPFLTAQAGNQGKIVAIDISKKMLEVAQRKYQYDNVSFVCGNVLDGELPEEHFDLVICYSVFPHFEDKQFAVSIMSRYLKRKGKFIICHSQSREAINNLHRNASQAVAEDNLPCAATIKNYFHAAGLNTAVEIDNDEMFVIIAEK